MTIPTRGRPPSEEKRQAILLAAQRLFAAKGVDATATREIAAAAETTERTLFKHFGSKQGLVQATIDQVSFVLMRERNYARITDPTPFTTPEFEAWHTSFLQDRVASSKTMPETYGVLFRELFRDQNFRERYAADWLGGVLDPLAQHLARMQTTGAIRNTQSPYALASAFFSLNIGYLVSRFVLMPDFPWDDGRDIGSIVKLFTATCLGE